MAIKRLPVQLANQIAAGEVVERPSSVVKELVENSLDAGAQSIEIDIEKGGHKRIRIKDDGVGIPRDELELALSPHSTSKISTLDDLESIASLGFRGEALASISSVSRLVLTSKPETQEQAWSAIAEGRDMQVELQPVAHPNGTTIDVCDLFYNTPARRKFLRAEKTEFQHIEDIVKRIALSRSRVSFTLKHNGKIIKRWLAASKQWEDKRIAQVCGNQFAHQAHKIALTYEGVTITAWVGGSDLMRSATDMQFSFVNGRAMRDKLLLHAIRQAYETSCAMAEQPSYVMFIDLSPNDVDVNVHPAKHEVRFHQARHIHDLVCKAFQDGLSEQGTHTSTQPLKGEPNHDYIQPLQVVNSPSNADPRQDPRQAQPQSQPYTATKAGGFSGGYKSSYIKESSPSQDAVKAYTSLMSVADADNGYIKIANKGMLKVVDNLVLWISVSECVSWWLEDKLKRASMPQPLLMPVVVNVDSVLNEPLINQLTQLHFTLQVSGTKCILKQVPASIRQLPWGRLFPAIIDELCRVEKIDESALCVMLSTTHVLLDDDMNQSLIWYMNLPAEDQKFWSQRQVCEKPLDDFIQWIES